jgi:hypothetical protein
MPHPSNGLNAAEEQSEQQVEEESEVMLQQVNVRILV